MLLSLLALSVNATCAAPPPVPRSVKAPNSTFYTDVLPPARFSHAPKGQLTIRFGQAAINGLCGRPPCGMIFEACTSGNVIALPDPFSTDPQTFMRILKHELAHVAGWPDTHGD